MSTKPKPTTDTSPTYTLKPEMHDGRLVVHIPELGLEVKTETTNLNQALSLAENAILDYLDKQEQEAQPLSNPH